MPACVVTGGTGNVGHALVCLLLELGFRVYVLCNPDSRRLVWLPHTPECHILRIGLDELSNATERIGEDCRFFFHLAWHASYGPERDDPYGQVRNIETTLKAVELAKTLHCEAFLGTGSQAQYGDTDTELTENTPQHPTIFYGQTKLCAEQMSRTYCAKLGLRHVWARILSVYGPCDGPYTLVTYLMRCFLQGETAHVTEGEQLWDFLYARDAACALIALAKHGKNGHAYCVASGHAHPLHHYFEIWREVTNGRAHICMDKPYPPGIRRQLGANISKLINDTNFRPSIDFDTGMRQTLSWYTKHPEALAL